ncbi:hypothetical protein KJ780_01630 [Candidatus Micrarchaeota archaeon]|nr:hypothetical protein [Candidatus Micrarchaeota archaeon]
MRIGWDRIYLPLVATILLVLLSSQAFASNICPSCAATYIVTSESEGTIKAVVFEMDQTVQSNEQLNYFNNQIESYLARKRTDSSATIVNMDIGVKSVKNAELCLYYYDKEGKIAYLTGAEQCDPIKTENEEIIQDDEGNSYTLYYVEYTIPKALYENSHINVVIEYQGDETRKSSKTELTIYDTSAGGINALADALQRNLNPKDSFCFASMVVLGMLLASMYFSGKSPLSYLDITIPKTTKPKAVSYGGLTAGLGNIRIGKPSAIQSKMLDRIINRYSAIEMRRAGLSLATRNAISKSGASSVVKYFAILEAARGGNWRGALGTDARTLMINNRGNIPHQALAVLNQKVEIEKFSQGIGTVTGNQPKKLKELGGVIRMVPLIGTFSAVAIGSLSHSLRTGKNTLKAIASPFVRKAIGRSYSRIDAKPASSRTLLERTVHGIASATDPDKIVMGQFYMYHNDVARLLRDTMDSAYDEICKNLLWHDIVRQLEARGHDVANLLNSQMDFRQMFTDPRFISALSHVNLNPEYQRILRMVNVSSEERARMMMNLGLAGGAMSSECNHLFNALQGISGMAGTDFDRMNALVSHLENRYQINQSINHSGQIIGGQFFMMMGRDRFYHEENGQRRNFSLIALGLNEVLDNMVFLSTIGRNAGGPENFTIADAFKIAWLKITSQVFGHYDWTGADEMTVDVTDPVTGKNRKRRYAQDVLGISTTDMGDIRNRMNNYFNDECTAAGRATGKQPMDLLYGHTVRDRYRDESKEINPLKRRYPYFLDSEISPEEAHWKGNMDFMWPTITSGIATAGRQITLMYEVRGQKFWSSTPAPGEPWTLMENHMSTRLANMMNGSQPDVLGHEKALQMNRFSRVNMYAHFNENWSFFRDVNRAYLGYFNAVNGRDAVDNAELEHFLDNNRNVTYSMIRDSNIPFIYTHDMKYVPYTKNMSMSDFDRVVNGVFLVRGRDGAEHTLDMRKRNIYEGEIQGDVLGQELNALRERGTLVGLEDNLKRAGALRDPTITNALKEIKRTIQPGVDISQFHAACANLRTAITASGFPASLYHSVDLLSSGGQAPGPLSHADITRIRDAVHNSSVSNEAKAYFIYEFSRASHDWESLWKDQRFDFFRLGTDNDIAASQRGWLGRFVSGMLKHSELVGLAIGSDVSKAMSNNNAVSELYRERGYHLWAKTKAGDFLDDLVDYNGNPYSAGERRELQGLYNDYADKYQSWFAGWVDSVTRHPSGSSTQWGRQWYLQTMYHRGGAMHPEATMLEKVHHGPLTWFGSQTFFRSASINNMLMSPIVRMFRSFQTSTYGYGTVWDKNIPHGTDFDFMTPWGNVQSSFAQRLRSMSPQDSVLNISKISLGGAMKSALGVIPGLNILPYFFPSLEKSGEEKTLGEYDAYGRLANTWGFRSLLGTPFSQRNQRAGRDIVDGVKQSPEDFLQYQGGAFVHHFTDSANPGLSYVGYRGKGLIAPRMARYLATEVTGTNEADAQLWRDYYSADNYVNRQASFSVARRRVSADAKRLHFQEELTGYGAWENPMWAALGAIPATYHALKGAAAVGRGIANWATGPKNISKEGVLASLSTNKHTCRYCGSPGIRGGYRCNKCGRFGG